MFAVETLFVFGWENCWRESGEDGTYRPMLFPTREAAEAELKETLETARDSGMQFDPADYRIVTVGRGRP